MSDARSDYASFSNSYAGEDIMPLRAAPTVSRTQWTNFAMRKLSEGFSLIQDPTGKRYTFYQPGRPTQTCPPHAAKRLLAAGLLIVNRTSARGLHYVLADVVPGAASVSKHESDEESTANAGHAFDDQLLSAEDEAGDED